MLTFATLEALIRLILLQFSGKADIDMNKALVIGLGCTHDPICHRGSYACVPYGIHFHREFKIFFYRILISMVTNINMDYNGLLDEILR